MSETTFEEFRRQVSAGARRTTSDDYAGLSASERLGLQEAERVALWRHSPRERLAAYRAGELTRYQLGVWAANALHEVPLVNDELPWIVAKLADVVEEGQR